MSATLSVPPGTCDCHVHVFGDATYYPFDPASSYIPGPALLDELLALHGQIGVARTVLVQPSPYGTDNRCMLEALARLGQAGRAVAVIDRHYSDEALRNLHKAGVRGVRVNLATTGQHDPEVARARLLAAAQRVAQLGWHVQTYIDLVTLVAIKDLLPRLPVTLVVDHFGRARAELGVDQPGLDWLLDTLAGGRIYVKLSAPERVSATPDDQATAALARAFINANPERVLWGTDWPHTGSALAGPPSVDGITPYRQVDDARALQRSLEWAGSPERARQMLVDNPARLYEF